MKNFGECTAEVLRYGFDDGPQINKARIEQWINEAQLQIARTVDAPEFQETSEITMVSGTYKYSLAAISFLQMKSIYYPELGRRLTPISIQTFDTQGFEVQGLPAQYTIYKNELWLFPTPTTADKLHLRYSKRPARMTAEADIPTLHEDYLHLLTDYALWRAYRAEDDAEFAQAHQTQYKTDLLTYANEVQAQQDDRPKQLDGTWR